MPEIEPKPQPTGPEALRDRNLETLRQTAEETVDARPAGRVMALALQRHRVPASVAVVLLLVFAGWTAFNLRSGGQLGPSPAALTEDEMVRSLELTAQMQAGWIERFERAKGRLPIAGEELSIDPEMGHYEPMSDGFILVVRGTDGRETTLRSVGGRREISTSP
jgi:hypothetical protein